jgi:hypothetical protein
MLWKMLQVLQQKKLIWRLWKVVQALQKQPLLQLKLQVVL